MIGNLFVRTFHRTLAASVGQSFRIGTNGYPSNIHIGFQYRLLFLVRDGDVSRADERLQGAVRQQRSPAVHYREVGQPQQLSQGAHLLQQTRPAALRELPAAEGATHQGKIDLAETKI